jgi:hypothetical protein
MTKLSKFNYIFKATKIKDEIQDVLDVALALNDNDKFIESLEILKIIQAYKKSLNCKETNNLCEKFSSGIFSIKGSNKGSTQEGISLQFYECVKCKGKYFDQDYVLELIAKAKKELSKEKY